MIVRYIFGSFQRYRNKSVGVLLDRCSNGLNLYQNADITKVIVRQKSFPGQSNAPGHGAGKGGGAGGTIRESGGGLGEYGTAQEEGYFFNKQREQLLELKKKLKKNEPESGSRKSDK